MNKLDLSLKVVQDKDSLELSHIAFENSAFIWVKDKSDLIFMIFSMLIIIHFFHIIFNSKVIFL